MATNPAFDCFPRSEKSFRVTDPKSVNQFDSYGTTTTTNPVGPDLGYSTQFIEPYQHIPPYSVRCHLECSVLCEWKGMICVCSTQEKARSEIEWHFQKNRQDITEKRMFARSNFKVDEVKSKVHLTMTSTTGQNLQRLPRFAKPYIHIRPQWPFLIFA